MKRVEVEFLIWTKVYLDVFAEISWAKSSWTTRRARSVVRLDLMIDQFR